MVRKLKSIVIVGALLMVASPAFADDFLAPLFAPVTSIDLDPFHVFTPAPAAAPAAAPAVKKKHHVVKKRKAKKKKK